VIAAGLPSVKDSYAFRIVGNETGTPSKIYFIALVMGTPEQGGGANTVRKLASTCRSTQTSSTSRRHERVIDG
jgi:hypothetical protein